LTCNGNHPSARPAAILMIQGCWLRAAFGDKVACTVGSNRRRRIPGRLHPLSEPF
jgi:hypothetical protein